MKEIKVKIELFNGSTLGNIRVISDDVLISKINKLLIQRTVKDQIRRCVDRLFILGARSLSQSESKGDKKE